LPIALVVPGAVNDPPLTVWALVILVFGKARDARLSHVAAIAGAPEASANKAGTIKRGLVRISKYSSLSNRSGHDTRSLRGGPAPTLNPSDILKGDNPSNRSNGKMAKITKTAFRTTLLAATMALVTVTASAQGDLSKVEIKTTKVTNNFYTLEGSGGMIGILVGPDGVFMVDAQYAPLTDRIVAAIKKITDKPIRFLVNTHVHGDHTGGDENFGKLGVTILARENLRYRLAYPNPMANGQPSPAMPSVGLPMITYDAPLTMHMNGEDIRLLPVKAAHTDGDTLVVFPNNDVIMTGDFYRSVQYPNIDRANGGNMNGMLDGLAMVIGLAGPNTKIIPGHGATVGRDAVMAHRDILLTVKNRVMKLISEGKTQDEVIAAKPTADLDAKILEVGMTRDRFIGQVYQEIKSGK
jgi:glyoxylase-like metal-dependent hydrolase (beta-lactamase superfamily II)